MDEKHKADEMQDFIFHIETVPEIFHHFYTDFLLQKKKYKDIIAEKVKEKRDNNMEILPTEDSSTYSFQLSYIDDRWETRIDNDSEILPKYAFLPAELLEEIVSSGEINRPSYLDYRTDSYLYNVYYNRYTAYLIGGKIQRFKIKESNEVPVIDLDDFFSKPLEEQWAIMLESAENYHWVKKKMTFLFGTKLMPELIRKIS